MKGRVTEGLIGSFSLLALTPRMTLAQTEALLLRLVCLSSAALAFLAL